MVEELQLRVKHIDLGGSQIYIHCGIPGEHGDSSKSMLGALGSIREKLNAFSANHFPQRIRLKLSKRDLDRLLKSSKEAEMGIEEDSVPHADASLDSTPGQVFMEKVLQFIESNLSDDSYWVDNLAADMNVSRSTLFRKVKKLTGLAPQDFMRTVRLKWAAQLLQEGHYRVSEVAYDVGFSDPNYFSKCFRKYFDNAPSDYIPTLETAMPTRH